MLTTAAFFDYIAGDNTTMTVRVAKKGDGSASFSIKENFAGPNEEPVFATITLSADDVKELVKLLAK